MATSGSRWYESLIARVIIYLSLALLPIGLIAVMQTRELALEIDRSNKLALSSLTERSAAVEQRIVARALGVAEVLGQAVISDGDGTPECNARFKRVVEENPLYSFAGFTATTGTSSCLSVPGPITWDMEGLQERMDDPRIRIDVNPAGEVSENAVLIVNAPVFDEDTFLGYVHISVQHHKIEDATNFEMLGAPAQFVTFNRDGTILDHPTPDQELPSYLPRDETLAQLAATAPRTFKARSRDGQIRVFASVPVIKDSVFALSAVRPADAQGRGLKLDLHPLLFPVLMWIASLFVASFALNRLVVSHIYVLGRQMRRFAETREIIPINEDEKLPMELAQMRQNFDDMANSLIQDEAELQDALHDNRNLLLEKEVLLKEVHHRVKNNLQMISSIMNMQMRQVGSEETKAILKRLQDRIMSLAMIHRSLYETENLNDVNVGTLIKGLVDKMVLLGNKSGRHIDLSTEIEDVTLYPDRAVPLSLLVAEALTNALKHVGQSDDASLFVALRRVDKTRLELLIENTIGEETPVESTGMGAQLINAFAAQLEGDQSATKKDGRRNLDRFSGL